jgi:ATP-dependent Clp protease adaptor protein ClpS
MILTPKAQAGTRTVRDTKPRTEPEANTPWRVVVLNDPVNLMEYVVMVFRRVFGFSSEKARQHMLEVHHAGRSVVWSGEREQAELYVYQLQQWQLHALLECDA